MVRILIIEDDFAMAEAMKKQILSWGHEALCVQDFQRVTETFVQYDPHMVLVDIMLPFYNGYYWCSAIRKISNVPVIFISSASSNMNIIMAMEMGGDDFIPKPVDLSVMMAKIQALLRRTYDMGGRSRFGASGRGAEFKRRFLDLSGGAFGVDQERISNFADLNGK